jgi:hypothetical protein
MFMKRCLLLLLLVLLRVHGLHAQDIEVLTAHRWKARDTVYSDKNKSGRLIIEQYIDSVVVNATSGTYRARGKTVVFSPEKNYTSYYRISGKILSQSKKVIISYEEHSYEKTVAGEKLCPTKGKLRLYTGDVPGRYMLKGELLELCSRSFQPYAFYSEGRE